MKKFVVALDGPVAAGKGTLGRRLAEHFGFAYLDTGALYRGVALRMLRAGDALDDVTAMVTQARAITSEDLDTPELRAEATGDAASKVAPQPELRAELLDYQRGFASNPPDGSLGAILDGRDIGTVICPDADVKLYIEASAEVRAERRYAELISRGEVANLAKVRTDLAKRDAQDQDRTASPLARADDAHLLDTTKMDIEAAFAAARQIIADRLND